MWNMTFFFLGKRINTKSRIVVISRGEVRRMGSGKNTVVVSLIGFWISQC